MNIKEILPWIAGFWFVFLPLGIYLLYTITTELLDLILNSHKINQMLVHSDNLNSDPLLEQYQTEKSRQSKLQKSNLQEMERQINFNRLKDGNYNTRYEFQYSKREKIISAKQISDCFKVK